MWLVTFLLLLDSLRKGEPRASGGAGGCSGRARVCACGRVGGATRGPRRGWGAAGAGRAPEERSGESPPRATPPASGACPLGARLEGWRRASPWVLGSGRGSPSSFPGALPLPLAHSLRVGGAGTPVCPPDEGCIRESPGIGALDAPSPCAPQPRALRPPRTPAPHRTAPHRMALLGARAGGRARRAGGYGSPESWAPRRASLFSQPRGLFHLNPLRPSRRPPPAAPSPRARGPRLGWIPHPHPPPCPR